MIDWWIAILQMAPAYALGFVLAFYIASKDMVIMWGEDRTDRYRRSQLTLAIVAGAATLANIVIDVMVGVGLA